jgi:hypothetical protein
MLTAEGGINLTIYVVKDGDKFAFTEDLSGAHEPVLELVRSDQGDGGWSLHKPFQPIEDEESIKESLLSSGPAGRKDDPADPDGWNWDRPNDADIRAALAMLEADEGGHTIERPAAAQAS